ncbi:MAG: LysE family translocator [Nocardioides sp.]
MGLAFLITSLAIVATPGTGAILTIAAGLRGGRRAALVTAFGCTLGIVPHLAAAVTGTAALLRAGGTAFEILKIAGVAYLCYLAWVTWRDSGILTVDDDTAPASTMRTIANAVLANLLNPKLTLFFFAFLPQFVTSGSGALAQMLTLSGVFMAMTLLVFAGYGWFASAMRDHLVGRPAVVRRIQRVFSIGYLALGLKLMTVKE